MKSKLTSLFLLTIITFLFWGCENENIATSAITAYSGIELQTSDNGVNYVGTLSEGPAEFSILSKKTLNRVIINKTLLIDMSGMPEMGGTWGSISVVQSNNGYSYRFVLNANSSTKTRYFKFTFGGGDVVSIVNLEQQNSSN